jgi:hypothetical protein
VRIGVCREQGSVAEGRSSPGLWKPELTEYVFVHLLAPHSCSLHHKLALSCCNARRCVCGNARQKRPDPQSRKDECECGLVSLIFLLRFSRHGICCGCLFTTAANHDPTQQIR